MGPANRVAQRVRSCERWTEAGNREAGRLTGESGYRLRDLTNDRRSRDRSYTAFHRIEGRSQPLAAVLGPWAPGLGDRAQWPHHQLSPAPPEIPAARCEISHRE